MAYSHMKSTCTVRGCKQESLSDEKYNVYAPVIVCPMARVRGWLIMRLMSS